MKRGIVNRLIATVLSAALIADAPASIFASAPSISRLSPAPSAVFTQQALSEQGVFSILNYFRRNAAHATQGVRLPLQKAGVLATGLLLLAPALAQAQDAAKTTGKAGSILIVYGLSIVILGAVAELAVLRHLRQRRAVRSFDKGFNIQLQPLEKKDLPPTDITHSNDLHENLTEIAAISGAISVVANGYRGKGSQSGLTEKEISKIKNQADGHAFKSILNVFRAAWAGIRIYSSEGKGRDGVEESFVGGDFTGVRGLGRWITRRMHAVEMAILFGFIAIIASMDVIEGTTATVMNLPGLSGGTTVIVSGPGVKSLGQFPDIYADMIATRILPHHVADAKNAPLDPNSPVMTNLERIAEWSGRPIAQMEVVTIARPREFTRIQAMLPHLSPKHIQEAIDSAAHTPLGAVLEDPVTHLMVRLIPDGTFLPVIKAALEESITAGRHLVCYGSSGAPEGVMDLAAVAGYRDAGAIVSLIPMSKGVTDVEKKTGAYDFTIDEIEGKTAKPAVPATATQEAQEAKSAEPGLRPLRPDDYQDIQKGKKIFTLWHVHGDVDAVIPFITDNPLWNQRGIRINGGTATSTLRIRTVNGKAYGWFKHRSDRLKGVPKRIAIMGTPGAGKGEHGPALARELGVPLISISQLLTRARQNDQYPEVEKAMANGVMVKDEFILGMLLKELSNDQYKDGYVLDGFPRTPGQVQMVEAGLVAIEAYAVFEIPEKVYYQRAQERYRKAKTAYDAAMAAGLPAKEPRVDDANLAMLKVRYGEFIQKTLPGIRAVRLNHPEQVIHINTESPAGMQFENPQQSIDYTYEYQVLPAVQKWIARQRPNGNGRKPRSGGWFRNGKIDSFFDHPTLSNLGLGAPSSSVPAVTTPIQLHKIQSAA